MEYNKESIRKCFLLLYGLLRVSGRQRFACIYDYLNFEYKLFLEFLAWVTPQEERVHEPQRNLSLYLLLHLKYRLIVKVKVSLAWLYFASKENLKLSFFEIKDSVARGAV